MVDAVYVSFTGQFSLSSPEGGKVTLLQLGISIQGFGAVKGRTHFQLLKMLLF